MTPSSACSRIWRSSLVRFLFMLSRDFTGVGITILLSVSDSDTLRFRSAAPKP